MKVLHYYFTNEKLELTETRPYGIRYSSVKNAISPTANNVPVNKGGKVANHGPLQLSSYVQQDPPEENGKTMRTQEF